RVTGNKDLAKKLFAEFDVPFPEGKRFSAESNNYEIIEYAKEIGFPLVLKPTKGFQGIGVVANIMTEEYLNESLKYVREELGYMDVIVERFIRGKEYRLYVIENEVIAAINRVPANIIGDGNHTIRQLIKLKNKQRLKNPRLAVCLIKVDYEVKKYVEKAGLTLDSVLENGEILYLREKSNISTGGDSIDVLDELPATMKSTAVNALKSIPGLPHGGVDLIYDDTNPDSQAYVLEINAIPQIGSLVYPMKGKGRDIRAALIDYYFPETKNMIHNNYRVYYDFKSMLQPLVSKLAEEITITPPPSEPNLQSEKLIIKGNVQNVGYRRWARKRAIELDLHGSVQNKNKNVEIVIAGNENSILKFKTECAIGPKRANIEEVLSKEWNKPIKIGFEIKESVIHKPKVNKNKKTNL